MSPSLSLVGLLSSRSQTQDCLFRRLFWNAGNGGMVTQPVRRLVDLTVDAYTNWTGTWDESEVSGKRLGDERGNTVFGVVKQVVVPVE